MDDKKRKSKLNENLKKALSLQRLASSKDYIDVLLPYLQKLAQVPYVDPTRFKTEEEFLFALKSANSRAGAYAELLTFLSQQEVIVKKIRQEIEKPPKNYAI